jgi:hypothetical protein
MAKALKLPEQVAVQYFACDRSDMEDILYEDFYDLQPSSFELLLKNKSFQTEADLYEMTCAAIRTLDLDFLKKYLEQVKPDLNYALVAAAGWGFTDAVKLLLSYSQVDPSARDNWALLWASQNGHLEIVKLLLADDRVDPSAQNSRALVYASQEGHLEIVKLLLLDDRVDPHLIIYQDIQYRDILTLENGKCLNDEIINFYAQLIMDRAKAKKVHVYNTFFYSTLFQGGGYSKVKKWSKKVSFY